MGLALVETGRAKKPSPSLKDRRCRLAIVIGLPSHLMPQRSQKLARGRGTMTIDTLLPEWSSTPVGIHRVLTYLVALSSTRGVMPPESNFLARSIPLSLSISTVARITTVRLNFFRSRELFL